MHAQLRAIEYYLPEGVLSSAQLEAEFPDWAVGKIESKTGIHCRHIATPEESVSDLAVAAANKLFATGAVRPQDIDYVLLCTQSPDYFLPTTACLIQDRLGISTSAGALDYNLGCSGYIYGLGLAEGLIATAQASNILLLTGETYSKFIHPGDRSVRTIFGDAASATLLTRSEQTAVGPFVYGTDGAGAQNLIVPTGGSREPRTPASALVKADEQGNLRSHDNLFMNGPEVFNFTLSAVPSSVQGILEKACCTPAEIDLFVFHQANQYILEHLRKRMKIPPEKFYMAFGHCGNTVSSTIPIALKHASQEGRVPANARIMLVGFGVGYSWGATIWRSSGIA